MLNFLLTGGTTGASVDWSSLITSASFDGIINGVTSVLPVVIPVALTLMGIPIVWNFVRRMIKKH